MRGGINRGRPRRRQGNATNNTSGAAMSNGKIPFDVTFFEDNFQRVGPAIDDGALTTALLKRNADITPSTDEIQGVQNLITRVLSVLENLILAPGTFDACQVDEVRQVGSFKQGTILAGHKTADLVVILKTLPTKEAVEALSNKVAEELRQTECLLANVTNRGFDLTSVHATVRVLLTTVPHLSRKLDPEIHLDPKLMSEHWQAVRHCRWFEEHTHNSTVKVLVRILRDLRLRFSTLLPLSAWMVDLLAHFAVMNNPSRQAYPISVAFRRTLSLIAGGIYLPGYAGTTMRGTALTFEEQDAITATGQTLLRILAMDGYRAILGLDSNPAPDEILNDITYWNGIKIEPVKGVYDKAMEVEIQKIEEDTTEEDNTENMEPETS